MDCKEFQNLLIQLPYNELSQEESNVIDEHLKVCETCREILKENQLLYRINHKLKTSVPTNAYKKASIKDIIQKINSSENSKQKVYYSGRIGDLVRSRFFRIAINTAAVFLIALFCYQQIGIKRNLLTLNTKIESQTRKTQQQLPISIKEFTSLTNSQLEQFLSEYDKILQENQAMLRYLRVNHPEIYRKVQQEEDARINRTHEL